MHPNTRLKQNYLNLGTGHDTIYSLVLLTEDERVKAQVCVVCALKRNSQSLFHCSNCKLVCYYSVQHQRKHWKAHKSVCLQHGSEQTNDGMKSST